jgi:molecular chaperone GrpE
LADETRDEEAPEEAPAPAAEDPRGGESRQPGDGAPAISADPVPESEAAQAYHQRARLAEDRLAEVLAAYRQIKSENDGFRERISKNLQRRFTQRHETLLLKFIDILDNLDRALEAAQISYAGQPLLEGMILVRTQLLQRLQEEGLERIPVLGMPFDPAVSESVATQPVPDPDHHNLVVKELMRGYRVNGRIVRPSRVLIGAYSEDAAAAGPPAEEVIDNAPAAPALVEDTPQDASLEEIVAKVEAQSALFPGVLDGGDEGDEGNEDGDAGSSEDGGES